MKVYEVMIETVRAEGDDILDAIYQETVAATDAARAIRSMLKKHGEPFATYGGAITARELPSSGWAVERVTLVATKEEE